MQLTPRETAILLDVSEKTLYRWIDAGEIPVQRVNEQYRFHRGEILEWATARGLRVSAALFPDPEASATAMPALADAVAAGGVHAGVGGGDRESVLRAIVELLPLADATEREFLYQLLAAREAMGSTAIGQGIAIPHVRNPLVLRPSRPAVLVCYLAAPVEFGALDGRPVDTVFSLVTPSIRVHLHLLSRLSSGLHDPDFRDRVRARAGQDEIVGALRRAEARFASVPGA